MEMSRVRLPLFPTSTTGRWCRSLELDEARRNWASGKGDLGRVLDLEQGHLRRWVEQQAAAGLDLVTDGEMWRDADGIWLIRWLEGVRLERNPATGRPRARCAGPLARRASLAGDRLRQLLTFSSAPLKLSLPGPHFLLRLFDDPAGPEDASDAALEVGRALLDLLKEEARELCAAGVAMLVLDETTPSFTGMDALPQTLGLVNGVTDLLHEVSAVRTVIRLGEDPGPCPPEWVQGLRASQLELGRALAVHDVLPHLGGKELGVAVVDLCPSGEVMQEQQVAELSSLMEAVGSDKIFLTARGDAVGAPFAAPPREDLLQGKLEMLARTALELRQHAM